MKKILFAVACSLFMVACSSATPEEVAKDFTEAIVKKGDYKKAKAFATGATGTMLDMAAGMVEGMGGMPKDDKAVVTAVTDSIKDEKAWVTVTTVKGDGTEKVESVDLVKEDGKWKVSLGSK